MAKFDIKTVKPKFVVTTSPENKIDVVVNKPIITSKISKSFFQLKNTGGPAGQPGRDGQDGESATIEVASTTTLPSGSQATVTNVGSTSQARLAFGIPKGDAGAAGADGQAATIQVGQVETLQPNQQCYVENVGSSTAAIFNIGIPKGEKGDSGSGSGDMTAATYDPNGTVAAAGGIPDYVDSNGGKIDTIKVNGTTQTITNKTVDLSVPTKTSDITNDSGYVTSTDYATNATGGVIKTTGAFGVDMSNSGEIKGAIVSSADYSAMWNDAIVSKGTLENALSTKGYALSTDIPTVNDATLTIQHNGTNVQTFTANQGTNATANIETIYAETITPTTSVATIGTTQIADHAVTPAKLSDTGWVQVDSCVNTTYFAIRSSGDFDGHIYYRVLGGVVYWRGAIYCHTAPNADQIAIMSNIPAEAMPASEHVVYGSLHYVNNSDYSLWLETVNNVGRAVIHQIDQSVPVASQDWQCYNLGQINYISEDY